MRTIKFRAWDKDTKTMVLPDMGVAIISFDGRIFEQAETPTGELRVNWKLMQFTGLTDKNGKEIYEGDWVKEANITDFEPRIYKVVWNGSDYRFGLFEFLMDGERHFRDASQMEVIGNIYENPELLNGKDL